MLVLCGLKERGGKTVFRTNQISSYRDILDELYRIAGSADYVRDMRIHEKLSSLLILLMEDAWDSNEYSSNPGNVQENMERRMITLALFQLINYDGKNIVCVNKWRQ